MALHESELTYAIVHPKKPDHCHAVAKRRCLSSFRILPLHTLLEDISHNPILSSFGSPERANVAPILQWDSSSRDAAMDQSECYARSDCTSKDDRNRYSEPITKTLT